MANATIAASETTVHEIAAGIYRISTPVPPTVVPGGFAFNQFLVVDDEPLLFHTGMRSLFPMVREAVGRVIDPATLRWIGFSHVEADECGSLNEWLAVAPRALADGETLTLGKTRVRWLDAPHLPHGWECGYLFEETGGALFCGDLLTQPGAEHAPVTTGDILGSSESMRAAMDYYAHGRAARALFQKLAATKPRTLACMHGSAWSGDGERLIGELADAVAPAAS